MPDKLNDLELFELVKTFQVHAHSKTCWKYNKNEFRFSCGRYLLKRNYCKTTRKFSNDEKQKSLTWRNTLLRQVKSCININRNPTKVNVIDPTKDIFRQRLRIKKS